MTVDLALLLPRRQHLSLLLCAALLPLAACKKKEEAPVAAATPAEPAAQPAAAPEPPKEEPPAELKAKWPAGRRLVVQVATQTETEMSNPALPQAIKTENLMTQEIAFTPGKEREGGGNEVDVEIVSVRSENKVGGKTVPVFDPKGDPKLERANPMAGAFRKLIGSHLKYQTAPDGSITKVDGVPQLMSKMTTGLPIQSQFLVRTMISEDAVRGWNVLHQNLPTNAVKPGATWETARDIPFGITKFTLTSTNTFKGWEQRNNKRLAKIETAGGIAPKPGAAAAITLGEGATLAGTSWYDPALGVIAESDLSAQFSVNVAQASGQAVTSKLKTKTTSKLTDAGEGGTAAAPEQPAPDKAADQKK